MAKCSPDRAGAGPDPPGIVGFVPGVDHSVELGEGVDFWDGDEVVASEPADLPLDAALLVRTLDSGLAIEGFDAVVGTDGGPPVGLDPLAGEPDHARDGGLEVVVADLPGRHPAEHVEGVDVTLEEGFLPSRGTDPVHGLARVGEPKAEQRAGYELAAQADGDVAEVNLGLAAREVLLRDERVGRFPSDLDANLTASGGDVLADHPVRHHPGPVMFVKQSIEDPLRRVSLLPRRVEVRAQPVVDHHSVRVKP